MKSSLIVGFTLAISVGAFAQEQEKVAAVKLDTKAMETALSGKCTADPAKTFGYGNYPKALREAAEKNPNSPEARLFKKFKEKLAAGETMPAWFKFDKTVAWEGGTKIPAFQCAKKDEAEAIQKLTALCPSTPFPTHARKVDGNTKNSWVACAGDPKENPNPIDATQLAPLEMLEALLGKAGPYDALCGESKRIPASKYHYEGNEAIAKATEDERTKWKQLPALTNEQGQESCPALCVGNLPFQCEGKPQVEMPKWFCKKPSGDVSCSTLITSDQYIQDCTDPNGPLYVSRRQPGAAPRVEQQGDTKATGAEEKP